MLGSGSVSLSFCFGGIWGRGGGPSSGSGNGAGAGAGIGAIPFPGKHGGQAQPLSFQKPILNITIHIVRIHEEVYSAGISTIV